MLFMLSFMLFMLSFMLTMPLLILSTEFRIVYSVEKHCIMRSVCLLCSDYAPIMLVYARLCSIMLRLCSWPTFLTCLKSSKYVWYGFDLNLTTNIHSNPCFFVLRRFEAHLLSTNSTDLVRTKTRPNPWLTYLEDFKIGTWMGSWILTKP